MDVVFDDGCAIGVRCGRISTAMEADGLLDVAYCGEAAKLFSGTATGACSPGLRRRRGFVSLLAATAEQIRVFLWGFVLLGLAHFIWAFIGL